MNPSFASPADRFASCGQPLPKLIAEIADCLDEIAFSHADCPGFCTCYIDPTTQRYLDRRLAEMAKLVASHFGRDRARSDGKRPAKPSQKDGQMPPCTELVSRVEYLRDLLVYAPMSAAVRTDLESRFREVAQMLGAVAHVTHPANTPTSGATATSTQHCHDAVKSPKYGD